MKKFFSFLMCVSAIACIVSCNKNNAPVVNPAEQGHGILVVRIGFDDESTKAALGDMKDRQINSAQIFVFNGTNGEARLETDLYKEGLAADGQTSMTLNTLTGNKIVYALVNHSRLSLPVGSEGQKLSEFEGTLTDLSEENYQNLVMSGKNTKTITDVNNYGSVGASQTMDIYVKRLASLIQLDKITVDFNGSSLEGASFNIDEIYLKNVVGKSPIGVDGMTGSAGSAVKPLVLSDAQLDINTNWYNKMTKVAGAPACLDDVYSVACNVEGSGNTINRVLFTYPNSVSGDSNSETWSPRHTRLVIKATVRKDAISLNKPTYYVLDLPVLAANTKYEIQNVKISQLGKDDDSNDDNIDVGKVLPAIIVDPWFGTALINYEF